MHRSALRRITKVSSAILLTAALVLTTLMWTALSVSAQEPTEQDPQLQQGGFIIQDTGEDGSGTGLEEQTPELFSDGSLSPDTTKVAQWKSISVPYMHPELEIPYSLADIIKWPGDVGFNSPDYYNLIITEDQKSDDGAHDTLVIKSGYNVCLQGSTGKETLTSNVGYILFQVKAGATLTIANLTLDANENQTLIQVEPGGRLILQEGATLKNCGGSAIWNQGTVSMYEGSSITGNDRCV